MGRNELEIGDSASNFDDFEVGAGGEVELFSGGGEELAGGRGEFE